MKKTLSLAVAILTLTVFTATAEDGKPQLAVAAKQTLTTPEKEQLQKLVADNEIVASVTLGPSSFTGACNVHTTKVTSVCKGKLANNTHLFASLDSDKSALPAAISAPKNPLPKLSAGDYVVIVYATEIMNSFPGNHKKSYNYFIQTDGKKHCAWEKNSPEALYVLKLCGK